MEWILIIVLLNGTTVEMRTPYASQEECIGAGEVGFPQCRAVLNLFDRVTEVCVPRQFYCVPQRKTRAKIYIRPAPAPTPTPLPPKRFE
jgi:hypothetical protein